MDYQLIDSGFGEKLERFGRYTIIRPCSQAIWSKSEDLSEIWSSSDASFSRRKGLNWKVRNAIPESWIVQLHTIKMKLKITNFGHVGFFPETLNLWENIREKIIEAKAPHKKPFQFLNLFAYSGGATMAASQVGAHCCHVDASKGMVQWAKENAQINLLADKPIRWIVDDVNKFLKREIRRGTRYDGILLDPPSFGRGKSGELYKIENAIIETLENVRKVLSDEFSFIYLTSHTPGFTPTVLSNLLNKLFDNGSITSGEMLLKAKEEKILNIPNGSWSCINNISSCGKIMIK